MNARLQPALVVEGEQGRRLEVEDARPRIRIAGPNADEPARASATTWSCGPFAQELPSGATDRPRLAHEARDVEVGRGRPAASSGAGSSAREALGVGRRAPGPAGLDAGAGALPAAPASSSRR
jgi:hypothetical protein